MIMKEKVRYVEELAKQIKHAKPYYVDSDAKLNGGNSKVNDFPNESGVYLIMRRVDLPQNDYTTVGVNTKSPIVIYVGKTTARRSIKQRLSDHFGGVKLSYQGSQFRKFIFQICQNDDVVKSILWSKDTLIACVPVPEQDEVIDIVEKIAMQVFQPRFNIKDR